MRLSCLFYPFGPNLPRTTVTNLYDILFNAVISSEHASIGHGRNGYYFGGSGDYLWYDLSEAIGKALVKRGLIEVEEPTAFTREELIKYFGSEVSFLPITATLESYALK